MTPEAMEALFTRVGVIINNPSISAEHHDKVRPFFEAYRYLTLSQDTSDALLIKHHEDALEAYGVALTTIEELDAMSIPSERQGDGAVEAGDNDDDASSHPGPADSEHQRREDEFKRCVTALYEALAEGVGSSAEEWSEVFGSYDVLSWVSSILEEDGLSAVERWPGDLEEIEVIAEDHPDLAPLVEELVALYATVPLG